MTKTFCDFCGDEVGNPYYIVEGKVACSACKTRHEKAKDQPGEGR